MKYTDEFNQQFKRNKEIRYSDVKHIECYCFGCGKHMGGIHYIESTFSYMTHIPLCVDCWKATGWTIHPALVSRGVSE